MPIPGLALDDESVWVRSGDEFLVRVDRKTGDRVERITADVTSGGDIIVVEGRRGAIEVSGETSRGSATLSQ